MQENTKNIRAQRIRDVIRYIRRFQNAVTVIHIDDEVIDSPVFSGHMKDISLIHQAGLKVIIVPGARTRIDQILKSSGISWKYENGIRITDEAAIPKIKMAAFDVSNIVMTSLAADHITAVIGNWVRARSKGVLDGIDYGTAGEIDKIQTETLRSVLANGFIPIFPCIGWSAAGKPYNISSVTLAEEIAVALRADKLFFITMNAEIGRKNYDVPESIGLSEDGEIPAMNLEELKLFLARNKDCPERKILSLLETAGNACRAGVSRAHIVSAAYDGALPCEIFSDLGSGTMIYSSDYGGIRPMLQEDIPSVLSLIRPFVEKKILLPRTDRQISEKLADYIVYELDGGIQACAALHIYPDGQAEIAAVAVRPAFANLGIGPKMIEFLIDRAGKLKIRSVFILTTQTADWFENMGFLRSDISTLPEQRKSLWSPERNSKLYRLQIK